jgi:hypothetical protein
MECDEVSALALVCAAVRETFEESGVLLAGPTSDTVVADTTGADWEADRRALEGRDLAFTDFLARRGLVLRTDLLRFWGRWITPVVEPKRYDTRFFVAELPEGQVTRDVSTESDQVEWLSPEEATRAVDDGRLSMLTPTYVTCLELSEYDDPDAVLAAAPHRDGTPIQPRLVFDDDGDAMFELPARVVELDRRLRSR